MSLFQVGDFTLHSGEDSDFKIDCDFLTDQDIETCAYLIAKKVPTFCGVRSVPTGGDRLAAALQQYRNAWADMILVVDDVLTSGQSLLDAMEEVEHTEVRASWGAVIFARTSPRHIPNSNAFRINALFEIPAL